MDSSKTIAAVTEAAGQVSRCAVTAFNYYVVDGDVNRYKIECARLALTIWEIAVAERDRIQHDPLPRTVLLVTGFLAALYASLRVTGYIGRKLAPIFPFFILALVTILLLKSTPLFNSGD